MSATALKLVHSQPEAPARPAARPDGRLLLGEQLRRMGALSEDDLAMAVALQRREDARFGDILLANGMVTEEELYQALSEQHGAMIADLEATPPDARLIDELGADFCIRNAVLPWKRAGAATIVICSRPDEFARIARELPENFGQVHLALAPEPQLQAALVAIRHRSLTRRAEGRVEAADSCRGWNGAALGRRAAALVIAFVALFIAYPLAAMALLTGWAVLTLVGATALKLLAAREYLRLTRTERVPFFSARHRPDIGKLPTVSIMVPLFKEREIAGRLVKRLEQLSYPRELLDICLVVEADDTLTQETLARADLPRWMRQITVPRGALKTKPRALNFALDFCRGSIVGVYDAEDSPEPDQIHRVVRRFHERGPEVACLQGKLDFYNSRTNWLARCFTIEYATWFRIILPGIERLGLVVPLGGTTLFFRREALEKLGGWDAHNVTEDADLGIRLARRGYRTEIIETVTEEEANCRPLPWIKQRSRWIKGYAMTYGVAMRSPGRLLAELGWRKFLGVQVMFLGTLSQFLLAPLLWSFWLLALGFGHPLGAVMTPAMFVTLGGLFAFSEFLSIAVGMLAVSGPRHRHLIWWVPTMHLYFPLATFAALKGFFEIFTRPFYWDKTVHGIDDISGKGKARLNSKITTA